MNKLIKWSVPAVLVLSLTACAGNSNQATSSNDATVQEQPQYQAPAPSKEDVFFAYVSSEFPDVDRATAVELGYTICQALSNGRSLLEIGQTGVNSGFTPEQAGKLVGASIGALCPEYKYLVDQLS